MGVMICWKKSKSRRPIGYNSIYRYQTTYR